MSIVTVEKASKKTYLNPSEVGLNDVFCLLMCRPVLNCAVKLVLLSLFLMKSELRAQQLNGGTPSTVLNLSLKVFLEGPYIGGGQMQASLTPYLSAFEHGPAASPDARVGKMRPGYTVPAQAIDVITVELRAFAAKATTLATAFAWLMQDGSVLDFETGLKPYLTFGNLPLSEGGWHVVVKHRNHLSVMSSSAMPITLVATEPGRTAAQGFADLSVVTNIYGAGFTMWTASPVLMIAGNADNSDQRMTEQDFDLIKADADSPLDMGYKNTDFNLDAKCNATDADRVMLPSTNSFLISTALNP
jgi:hypothetical protein